MSCTPLAPFDRWPIDVHMEGVGFAWYLHDRGAFVTQSYAERGTTEAAEQVNDYLDEILKREDAHLTALGGITILYDWRTLRTVEPAAGPRFIHRMAQRKRGYLRRSFVVFHSSSALIETAIRAASAFAAVAVGRKVELTSSIDRALQETSVIRMPAAAAFGSVAPPARAR